MGQESECWTMHDRFMHFRLKSQIKLYHEPSPTNTTRGYIHGYNILIPTKRGRIFSIAGWVGLAGGVFGSKVVVKLLSFGVELPLSLRGWAPVSSFSPSYFIVPLFLQNHYCCVSLCLLLLPFFSFPLRFLPSIPLHVDFCVSYSPCWLLCL